jgi:hypothetical protein
VFCENLHNILQEIYHLVRYGSFSAEYIESISPLERKLLIGYWHRDEEENNKEPGTYNVLDDNIPQGINMQGLC